MEIDYNSPRLAIATQQLLWAAGIDAVYIPYMPLDSGAPDDPLFVHRLRLPDRDVERARRVLEERERVRW